MTVWLFVVVLVFWNVFLSAAMVALLVMPAWKEASRLNRMLSLEKESRHDQGHKDRMKLQDQESKTRKAERSIEQLNSTGKDHAIRLLELSKDVLKAHGELGCSVAVQSVIEQLVFEEDDVIEY